MVEKVELSDKITKEWREIHIGGATIYIAPGSIDCTTAIRREDPDGESGVYSLLLVDPKQDDIWVQHVINLPRFTALGNHSWRRELPDGVYIVDEEACVISAEDNSSSCDLIYPIEGNVGLWEVVPIGS